MEYYFLRVVDWPDGRVYEDDWVNDKVYCRGMYIHMEGVKYNGEWRAANSNLKEQKAEKISK